MNSICKKIYNQKCWVILNTKNDMLSYFSLGVLHRENGPAVEELNGSKHWYINGKLYKEDGPAKEYYNGIIYWCRNGKDTKPTIQMMKKYIRLNPDNILKDYQYPLKIQKLAISLKPSIIFNIPYPHKKLKELYPQLFVLKDSVLI